MPILTALFLHACKNRDREVQACALTHNVAACLMHQYAWDRTAALAADYRVHHPHGPPMNPKTCKQCH